MAELPELGPGARINGRIDRLAVTKDQVLILDFKTNRPPPATENEVPQIYFDPGMAALPRRQPPRFSPASESSAALFLQTVPGFYSCRMWF